MNKQIKEVTLASIILAITIVLCMVQIPMVPALGLTLDFSYVALIIGRRYIGYIKSIIICFIFPWFTIFSIGGNGGLPGALFLLLQSLFVINIDYFLMKNKVSVKGIMMTILLITIFTMFLNAFLIGPMYSPNFSDYYTQDLWSNVLVWMIVALWFNPLKFIIIYIVIYLLLPKLNKEIKYD